MKRHKCPRCFGDGTLHDSYMNPFACTTCGGKGETSTVVLWLHKLGLLW